MMMDSRNCSAPLLRGFAFVDDPIDHADALRDDAEAVVQLWRDGRVLVLDAQGEAFATSDGGPHWYRGGDLGGGPGSAIFLGLRDGGGWFCAQAEALALPAATRIDLRQAAARWSPGDASAFAYARAISHWRARTRFCAYCGGAIGFVRGGFVGRCEQCRSEHYPRVDPAVIVAVSDGEHLLLGRQASWVARRYSVIAGFVEPGESLEQAVAREVAEETGIRIAGCRYLGAQPWPFPAALMLGFRAWAEPGQTLRIDAELEDARWFSRAEVSTALAQARAGDGDAAIGLPPPISIARALIEDWLATAPR